jgi:hypothetical protein
MQVNIKFKLNVAAEFAGVKARERGARPEDAVRLYDGLTRAAHTLDGLAKAHGVPPAIVQVLVATAAASAALFSAGRGLYVGLLRLGRGEAAMACALFKLAQGRLGEAAVAAEGVEGAWAAAGLQWRLHEQLEEALSAYTVIAHAEALADGEAAQMQLARGIQVCDMLHCATFMSMLPLHAITRLSCSCWTLRRHFSIVQAQHRGGVVCDCDAWQQIVC